MPKVGLSAVEKANKAESLYPQEFLADGGGRLYCLLCKCFVSCKTKFRLDSHRNSRKHQIEVNLISDQTSSNSTPQNNTHDFAERVTRAFLAANIPLKKLRNQHVKKLFEDIGHPLPSETTCRSKVKHIAEDVHNKVKDLVKEAKSGIFMVFDETFIRNSSYVCAIKTT